MHNLLKRIARSLGISDHGPGLREKFWERHSLQELNGQEWEELCDGCGLCCLLKFGEDGSDEIGWTNVACRLLDLDLCRCRHYEARTRIVKDCIVLEPNSIDEVMAWMPATCAYRLLHEGKPLHSWHHLVSGSRESVHEAGISVRGRAISETEINMDDLEDYAIGDR